LVVMAVVIINVVVVVVEFAPMLLRTRKHDPPTRRTLNPRTTGYRDNLQGECYRGGVGPRGLGFRRRPVREPHRPKQVSLKEGRSGCRKQTIHCRALGGFQTHPEPDKISAA